MTDNYLSWRGMSSAPLSMLKISNYFLYKIKVDSRNFLNYFSTLVIGFFLTLKKLWGQFELPHSSCGFSKNAFSRYRKFFFYFVAFNIIKSHIFPENFIEIPQTVQKIWSFSPSILTIFIGFRLFWHFFVAKKLMASVYQI